MSNSNVLMVLVQAAVCASVGMMPVAPAYALAPTGPAAAQTAEAARDEIFYARAREIFDRYEVPALSVAVFTPEGLVAVDAMGVRRLGEAAAVEIADPFAIASITKPMTATLAAVLVDHGRIGWETRPADIWPGQAAGMHPALRGVTLAQLLSHRGGIAPFTADEELEAAPPTSGSPREQRAAFARWLLERPPAFAVGEHHYSNAGYGLAAAMLEEAADESWETLLTRHVFEPLALSSCGFGWPRADGGGHTAHRVTDGVLAPAADDATMGLPATIAPAGGVHCNMADLGRFGQMHMLGLLGRHPFLRPETFRAMHAPAAGGDYGLGWNVQPAGSSHMGGLEKGWHAILFISPQRRITVATAVNARQPEVTDALMTEITQLAFDLFGSKAGPASKES